ncbi:MAG: hypothetical protein CPSOU_1841 [uncultured Paraburkholderia sp.]|nr:MAG: hypothetical protein CPSOU_1841 [uncultured Paraburkholderia sp.]
MGYRTLRKFKQAQREYEHHQDREQDRSFETEPPLTEEEREQIASDEYWRRLDAEVRLIGVGEWYGTPR